MQLKLDKNKKWLQIAFVLYLAINIMIVFFENFAPESYDYGLETETALAGVKFIVNLMLIAFFYYISIRFAKILKDSDHINVCRARLFFGTYCLIKVLQNCYKMVKNAIIWQITLLDLDSDVINNGSWKKFIDCSKF